MKTLKFIWTNLLGIIYFMSAAVDVFYLLLITAVPIIAFLDNLEIDWLNFTTISFLALGYPIAFALSYKKMVSELKEQWAERK